MKGCILREGLFVGFDREGCIKGGFLVDEIIGFLWRQFKKVKVKLCWKFIKEFLDLYVGQEIYVY